jgi:hypothetical protein
MVGRVFARRIKCALRLLYRPLEICPVGVAQYWHEFARHPVLNSLASQTLDRV